MMKKSKPGPKAKVSKPVTHRKLSLNKTLELIERSI